MPLSAEALARDEVHRAARLLHDEWTAGLLDVEQTAALLWEIWPGIRRPRLVLPVRSWVELFRAVGHRVGGRDGGHVQPRPVAPVRLYRGATQAGRFGLHWAPDIVVPRSAARVHGGHVWVADVEPSRLLATYLGGGHAEVLVDAAGIAMKRVTQRPGTSPSDEARNGPIRGLTRAANLTGQI